MEQSVDYLGGYINSYRDHRGLMRRFLEERGIVQEPAKIRAYQKALMRKIRDN